MRKEKRRTPLREEQGSKKSVVGGEVCTDWFVLKTVELCLTDGLVKEFLSIRTTEGQVYRGTVERVVHENVLDISSTVVVLFDESVDIHRW